MSDGLSSSAFSWRVMRVDGSGLVENAWRDDAAGRAGRGRRGIDGRLSDRLRCRGRHLAAGAVGRSVGGAVRGGGAGAAVHGAEGSAASAGPLVVGHRRRPCRVRVVAGTRSCDVVGLRCEGGGDRFAAVPVVVDDGVGAVNVIATANLRWLAGYRHPRHGMAGLTEALRVAFPGPTPLMSGAEAVGDPIAVLPVLFHLLWRHELVTDLSVPLHPDATVTSVVAA